MTLGPIATRVKMLTDGIYRAQRYGRKFRVPVHELLSLVDEVDSLENKNTAKPDNHEPRVREKAVAVGDASKEGGKFSADDGNLAAAPSPTKKESSAQKTKEQK